MLFVLLRISNKSGNSCIDSYDLNFSVAITFEHFVNTVFAIIEIDNQSFGKQLHFAYYLRIHIRYNENI